MPTRAKPKFNTRLPATEVTAEMRDRMIEIADATGESIASVQRRAFALFLSRDSRFARDESRKAITCDCEAAQL